MEYHISLTPYNTFGIKVLADMFTVIRTEADLYDVLGNYPTNNYFILGGGSNVLFTQDVHALVLKNEIKGIDIFEEDATSITLKIGGGEIWHEIVRYAVEKGWGGIENLSLIPGTIGAAPIQNIGAYGVELKEVFYRLDAIHLKTHEKRSFHLNECEFGYRESIFKHSLKGQYFITYVYLTLQKSPTLKTDYGDIKNELAKLPYTNYTIKDVSEAVINIRSSKLPNPKEVGNAGSFFKNPTISIAQFQQLKQLYPEIPSYPVNETLVKIPAAWLIQQCGWKGKNLGEYGVHDKQALVLVNYGAASGDQIYALSTAIISSVEEKFFIRIEREVNII